MLQYLSTFRVRPIVENVTEIVGPSTSQNRSARTESSDQELLSPRIGWGVKKLCGMASVLGAAVT